MTHPTPEGFIVADKEGNLIEGFGDTEANAWADAKRTLDMANITLIEDGEEEPEEPGDWMLETDLIIHPATAALLAEVATRGGSLAWSIVGGVACTRWEEEEAEE